MALIVQTKIGGNSPIMANALNTLGYSTYYFGALGKHTIHPLFKNFANQCKQLVSLADPGITEALEFYDGKIMLAKCEPIYQLNWDSLSKQLTNHQLSAILKKVKEEKTVL